jgi:hypothetical protein
MIDGSHVGGVNAIAAGGTGVRGIQSSKDSAPVPLVKNEMKRNDSFGLGLCLT